MTNNQIQFTDGAAYEKYMGVWSQLVGNDFLKWLSPKSNQSWLDIGCGNGTFTETFTKQCAPASIDGIDPSEEQLAFARKRPALQQAKFQKGDAMALPFAAQTFDIVVMHW